MPTTSVHSSSSEPDLDYTSSELSYGTISVGELCVAEKKQVILRDAPFQIGPAQKVGYWLYELNTARDFSITPEVVPDPWTAEQGLNENRDEGIFISGGLAQGLPSNSDERDEVFHSRINKDTHQLCRAGDPESLIPAVTQKAPLAPADLCMNGRRCPDNGFPDEVDVLPAVQLDPQSALRAARHLRRMMACRPPIRRRRIGLPVPHVWARRLALALDGEDPPEEALAKFAGLNNNERRLVTWGIFALEESEYDEHREACEFEDHSARWSEEAFAGIAGALGGLLKETVEARAYEKGGKIDEERDIVDEAWPSVDHALVGDSNCNRLPPGLLGALNPIDDVSLAGDADDGPQSTPRSTTSIPRVEFRVETQCSSDPCSHDHSVVPTVWLCLSTRHVADHSPRSQCSTRGSRMVKPISAQEKMMLVDAVKLFGARAVSKTPELCLIRESRSRDARQ